MAFKSFDKSDYFQCHSKVSIQLNTISTLRKQKKGSASLSVILKSFELESFEFKSFPRELFFEIL